MPESTQPAPALRELEGPPLSGGATGEELPVAQWLLSAATDVRQAEWEWAQDGLTFLRCGPSFTAIRLPGDLVRAAVGSHDPADVDPYLSEVLNGGPVIGAHGLKCYYALVPPGAGLHWRNRDAVCLAWGTWLGVPPVSRTTCNAVEGYWAVPMSEPGELCDVAAVNALVERCREWLGEDS
ncbi:hypothetical protein [Streptomyces sp. Root369]|uniref:hypothetical protein n=1 Tax=Streptomyces sp. Root369 TaxID=1736523 RepID=UPI000708E184|nr:hypothetical protein [Streptomyces sp. Root369]KQW11388.1 hypothetical protein ASD08_35525 [Streptomyces sp. Root369]